MNNINGMCCLLIYTHCDPELELSQFVILLFFVKYICVVITQNVLQPGDSTNIYVFKTIGGFRIYNIYETIRQLYTQNTKYLTSCCYSAHACFIDELYKIF